jgi:TonB family protein
VRADAEAGAGKFQPLGIIQTTEAVFPPAPLARGYLKGRATILIAVDASGKLTDFLAISYTQLYFAQAAQAALRQWTYEPARLNGRPVGVTKEIDFSFEVGGPVVVSQNISEFADEFLRRFVPDESGYRAYNIREIDGKLNAIRVVRPPYTKELAARGVSGTVTLAYYVDEKGRVRLPVVLNDADPDLASLAVEAMKKWQFEPPTRNGQPVLVWVRQDIRFNMPNRS